MKKTVFVGSRFVPALLLIATLSGVATAQKSASPSPKSEKNDLNVRIIERNGSEAREVERTYHIDGMSESERDKLVTKLVDSLKATRKGGGQRQMTIIVEDTNGDQRVTRERLKLDKRRVPADAYALRGRIPKSNQDFWNNQNWRYEFRKGTDSLADQLNRFKFQIPRDFDRQIARPFEDWARNLNGKPSTIRGLDAYPNNPDHNQLNVRFTAPAKGDISIIVTNPKGKEVAKREIKDFSGEFVGQIDLGKNTQGTYFITVTQNEDGAVKRIVVE
ncbi:T9SS type A sorting domain-containing protein [Spirosoma endophyticum]|uniref:Por secretion system C-terminal sorting domain-containing protein n=1 Tax=Spirosoma endophyticum TaxID=662367 RepID=A0A1I1X6L8_9BACT|nr:T9SS type A sorting domain-containing protein [Spirosoma endophyticum]SFE03044.1 Por secretion system C-terminal sorting domain-containing protein [Spirosoma endophyticum]